MKNILRLFFVVILTQFVIAQTPNFEGVIYSGEVPPDPVIAVSSDYIVQAVNKKIAVFNKSGTKLSEESFSSFFQNQSPPSSIFDPKVAYDQYSNRFILLAAGKNTNGGNSNYMLAVTQNADPTGSWHKYKLTAEDQGLTQYDIDFPGLGYDEEAIYLTSHQIYGTGGSISHYPKITILKKSEVYSNTISYRKDFWDFSPYPEKLKPMRKFGTSNGYFLVNTESAGQIRIWKIVNPLGGSNATLSSVSTIPIGNYSSISAAVQKGTQNTVDIGDHSISDVVCKDGYLYGAYTAQNTTSNGSMIVYFKVNTNNNYNLDINGIIETSGKFYYYPVLHPDNDGSIVFVFNKSSAEDYIGVAWTIRYVRNSNIEPIQWLKQGSTSYYHLLNGENRWGDYCGIALDPANGYRVWICGEWAYSSDQWSTQIGEISTGQTTDFTFTNAIYDENTGILNANAGGTLNVNSTPVNSGNTLPLVTGNSYTEKTNNERFPNWNSLGYTYKHNHWNEALDSKFLSNNLEANSSNTDQRAFFRSLNYSKIEARLDGSFISGKGDFQFQDPWYALSDNSQPTNYWISASGLYEPTGKEGATDKGVFLNQGGTGFTPPYYSVKANQVQSINLGGSYGIRNFYFLNWSRDFISGQPSAEFQDSMALQTGVVFKNVNAVVKANYKGNLLSNNTAGFSSNSQRKIVRTDDGKMHMVYESLGSVWYTISTDGGSTWQPEQRVNPSGTNAKGASIAESDDGLNYVYIVYQIDRDVFPYIYQGIILEQYQYGIQQWVRTVYELSYSYDAKPVVAAQNGVAYTVFKPTSSSTLQAYRVLANGTSDLHFSLNNTTSSSVNPSLAAAVQNFYLAYQNGNTEIRYFKFSVEGSISDYAVASYLAPCTNNYYPSLSTHNGDPVISWSGNNYSTPLIVIRRKSGSNWSSFKTCDNGAAAYPSNNNSKEFGSDGSIIAWTNMYNQSRCIKFVNGAYTSIYNLPSGYTGQDIQISNGDEFVQMKAINFDRSTSAPYALKPIPYNFNTMQKTTNGDEFNYARLAVLSKNNSEIVYGLGDVKLDGRSVKFLPEYDTIKIADSERMTSAITTESFSLSSDSKLEFSDCAYVIKRDKTPVSTDNIKPVIELVNSNTGVVLKLKDIAFIEKDTIDERTYYKLDCTSIDKGEYHLRVNLTVKENYEFCLSDCIYEENKLLPKKYSNEVMLAENLIPKEYLLEQNYPNPFNPTTTINYQIKEDGLVTLRIYDILGAELKTLVNEEKTKGRYTQNFDGSKLASGVYIYQLKVNDFVSSKKLILVK